VPKLEELLEPSQTAVVVIDMQNDFCSPDGATAKSGGTIAPQNAMLPQLQRFIAGARERGIAIVYLQTVASEATDSRNWLYRASDKPRNHNVREGTWGAELYGVSPLPGEIVVEKHRNNGFHNTRLDSVLRAHKIETLVVTGIATNVSVETTARDAVQRDYNVVLVDDCTAAYTPEMHAASVHNIRQFFGSVATGDEVLAAWDRLLSR
jgi:ureidoacrylate peracid hydrolase